MQIPIWISNRHIHLSQHDAEILFGKDYQFTKIKDLSQPWQFALQETISIQWIKNDLSTQIDNIRILWPRRNDTQVEVLSSDQYKLKMYVPTKLSWDIDNTPWIHIIWPQASITIKQGMIIAQRHLHISPSQAKKYQLTNHQIISIKTFWQKSITFHNIIVRIDPNFKLDFHIDFDEANAGNISRGDFGKIVRR